MVQHLGMARVAQGLGVSRNTANTAVLAQSLSLPARVPLDVC